MDHVKRIALAGAHNLRDLGGYPAAGGYTNWGKLYRSDALSDLTGADWQALTDRGVKTVIDLRTPQEAKQAPVLAPQGVEVLHFSLMGSEVWNGFDWQTAGMDNLLESMRLNYVKTLFSALPLCCQILSAILDRLDRGAVLFMCSAGKDRTGIIAAVILSLCAVAREDIVADYMVSGTYNEKGINLKMRALPQSFLDTLPDPALFKECLDSKPQTILHLLGELEARDIGKLLDQNGFPYPLQQKLVQALVAN